MMNHDVYIAYTTSDKLIADRICNVLEAVSIRCWIAPRDVRPGLDWAKAIVEAIRSSKIAVLIFSKNANQSKAVVTELSLAANMELPVLPVKIDDTLPTGIFQYYLTGSYWFELNNSQNEAQIGKLIEQVKALIE